MSPIDFSSTSRVQLFSALLYGTLSVVMVLMNKLLMDSFQFTFSSFILLPQFILSLIIVESLGRCRWIKPVEFSTTTFWRLFPVGCVYCLHGITSLVALSGMNVPLYAALKRCSPLVNLVLGVLVLRKAPPSKGILVSVMLITGGCVLAVFADIVMDYKVYFYGVFSVLCQGLYLTLIQRESEETFSSIEIFYYNAMVSLFGTLLYGVFTDDLISHLFNMDIPFSMELWIVFAMTIAISILFNFSIIWCTAENSALTTSIVGSFKQGIQSIVGAIWFGDVSSNPLFFIGIVMNFFGGFLYSYLKALEAKLKRELKHGGRCAQQSV